MHDVSIFLFTVSGLIIAGVLSERFFIKTHIPDALWMVLIGVLIGPVLGFIDTNFLFQIAPYVAAFCLIIILFDGGQHLELSELRTTLSRSVFLSCLSVFISMTAIAIASWIGSWLGVFYDWSWTKAFMFGAILGNTSPAIIIPTMRLAKVKERVTSMVSVESSLSDALSIVVATILIAVAADGNIVNQMNVSFSFLFAKSMGLGIMAGLSGGIVMLLLLPHLKGNYAYPIMLAFLLAFYGLVEEGGGSAPIAILIVAIMIGNAPILGRLLHLEEKRALSADVGAFHEQLSFVVKVFFFTFIGLMLELNFWSILLGLICTIVLVLCRYPISYLSLKGSSEFTLFDRKVIQACVPRGLAAGVLATLPFNRGVSGTEHLSSVVFSMIIFGVLYFSIRFAYLKRSQPIS